MWNFGNAASNTIRTRLASRENNFDALRLFAAFAVIVSHAFSIRDGDADREPYRVLSGYCTMGEIAVAIFFVISGLLVARSYLVDPSPASYLRKRMLRILPGLVVCVAACIFILGPAFTNLPLKDYFRDRALLKFAKNAILLPGRFDLPGVFVDPNIDWHAPHTVVNGSLWTLPIEFIMYLGVLFLGMAKLLRKRWCLALVAGALLFEWLVVERLVQRPSFVRESFLFKYKVWFEQLPQLGFFFFGGTLLLLFQDLVVIDWRLGLACMAIIAGSWRTSHGYFLFSLCLPYLVIFLAFARLPFINPILQSLTKWGDFSYGVYLYGYPVEQILFHTIGDKIGFPAIVVLSCLGTLALAVLSWHLVEKPFLKLKKRPVQRVLNGLDSKNRVGDNEGVVEPMERSIRPPTSIQRQYSMMRQVIFFV